MINFIDVGAAHYMIAPWDKNLQHIDNVLAFDITGLHKYRKEFIKTSNANIILHRYAIFDKKGRHVLYVCKRKRNSSLFKPDKDFIRKYIKLDNATKYKRWQERYDIVGQKEVICKRLDNILDVSNIDFDFIKIDTQGSDFNVIKSLGKYLSTQIIGIHTELFFQPLYKHISLFKEVDKFLRKYNFYMLNKSTKHQGIADDFVYIRDDKNKKDKIKFIKKIYKHII